MTQKIICKRERSEQSLVNYSRGPSLQDQTWCQILGPKPGPVAELKNWDLRVSVSVCVCVCCFLSFSVFLFLSLSFSVFLCLSRSFSVFVLQAECIVSRKTLLTRVCVFSSFHLCALCPRDATPSSLPSMCGISGSYRCDWKGRRWRFAGRRHIPYKGI